MNNSQGQLNVRVTFPKSLDEDPVKDLEQVGATDVRLERPPAELAPLLVVVVAAVIGVNALAELIMRWRDKHRCQQIIDTRERKIETKIDCGVKDGRIIVVTSHDDHVEITEAPKGFDLASVINAAISGGATAAKDVAQAAGASVAV